MMPSPRSGTGRDMTTQCMGRNDSFVASPGAQRRLSSASQGPIRRIRQACTSCRIRKTKCSGDRPTCTSCRRNERICNYEYYINPNLATSVRGAASARPELAADLLQRMQNLESQVAQLSSQNQNFHQPPSVMDPSHGLFMPGSSSIDFAADDTPATFHAALPDATQQRQVTSDSSPSSGRFNTLPPPEIAQVLVDNFFKYAHNQPYAYFHESRFRELWAHGELPHCLVYAVLSSAVRFTDHDYFDGVKQVATDEYARESWLSVLNDYLTAEDRPNLNVVQTTTMLAIVDFTAGRTSSAWLKIGMAVRIAQDLQLTTEPSETLSPVEQEEHRRTFWSIYLLDKLVSIGRDRPPAAAENGCYVQLPCSEVLFSQGLWVETPKLQDMLDGEDSPEIEPSNFGLTIIAASVIGRCARYVLHSKVPEKCPPWDSRSEYSIISSVLLSVEDRYMQTDPGGFGGMLQAYIQPDGMFDNQTLGHLLFAHVLLHTGYCLLNHPFLLRLRIKDDMKIPPAFLQRAFITARDHASSIIDILIKASAAGCNVRTSFYVYATSVAITIISMFIKSEIAQGREPCPELIQQKEQALEIVIRMGNMWGHASRMHLNLLLFDAHSDTLVTILDPKIKPQIDNNMATTFWSIVDYNTMCYCPPSDLGEVDFGKDSSPQSRLSV